MKILEAVGGEKKLMVIPYVQDQFQGVPEAKLILSLIKRNMLDQIRQLTTITSTDTSSRWVDPPFRVNELEVFPGHFLPNLLQ